MTGQGAPAAEQARVSRVRDFCEAEFARIEGALAQRRAEGFLRECHGDLHLENMLLAEGPSPGEAQVRLFDCLEFNPSLRWIDVMSDLAFVTMDLTERGRPELSCEIVESLSRTDRRLRGLVRFNLLPGLSRGGAHGVTWVRAHSADWPADEQSRLQAKASGYLQLAEAYTQPAPPLVVITQGISGSGKSVHTEALLEALPAIRLRSDLERQRLATYANAADRYSTAARSQVYRQMSETAEQILDAGRRVIVDATFLKRADRELFAALATRRKVPFVILTLEANDDELRRRIRHRRQKGDDPSEATADLLEAQRRELEPISPEESAAALVIDASSQPPAEIAARIEASLRG